MKYINIAQDKFQSLLTKLSILDSSNNISLTNMAFAAVIIKLMVAPGEGFTDIALFTLTSINYGHKRVEAGKIKSKELSLKEDDLNKSIQSIKSKSEYLEARVEAQLEVLKSYTDKLSTLKEQLDEQSKVVEEAKTLLTATKVASTFKRQQL